MKHTLPVRFKIIGLGMMVAGLLGFWLAATSGLINLYRVLDPTKALLDGSYPYPTNFWQLNQFVGYGSIVLIILGVLSFFFSQESDEFMYRVRLESLQFAAIAQIGITVCMSIYVFFTGSGSFENHIPIVVALSVVGFWLLYILRYSYVVYVRSVPNE